MSRSAAARQSDSEPAAGRSKLGSATISQLADWEPDLFEPQMTFTPGDARKTGLADDSVDLIVTSPPYWNKRDYGHADQIGLEPTPDAYVTSIMECLAEWRRVLRPHGSVFLNVGDTYFNKSLLGIPGQIEWQAAKGDWLIRNRIIWAKESGMPDPVKNRLAIRHEYVIHLTYKPTYYYDLVGYSEEFGNGALTPATSGRSTPNATWGLTSRHTRANWSAAPSLWQRRSRCALSAVFRASGLLSAPPTLTPPARRLGARWNWPRSTDSPPNTSAPSKRLGCRTSARQRSSRTGPGATASRFSASPLRPRQFLAGTSVSSPSRTSAPSAGRTAATALRRAVWYLTRSPAPAPPSIPRTMKDAMRSASTSSTGWISRKSEAESRRFRRARPRRWPCRPALHRA